uniref:N-terminal E2 ubiquitin-conjugating enzyme n=1 Tax=Cyprinus carpio TaxID=7962 RepID=A0A8C1WUZ1_CYPCA
MRVSKETISFLGRLTLNFLSFCTEWVNKHGISECILIHTTLCLSRWLIDMEGAPGTLYEGEKFQLLFKFSSRYPFDSPQVMFTGENIPVHPHVYSNGHICLSILTEDWSPALSVQSVCLSIISMLSSCKEKRRPPDNSFYVKTCNKNPKKTKWWYHGECIPLSSIKRLLMRVILVPDQSSNHFVCLALSAC